MEPRITRYERKIHLSWDVPSRINCSQIYPIFAPNGSSIILYGHNRGIRAIWRGGHRRHDPNENVLRQRVRNTGDAQNNIIELSDEEEQELDVEQAILNDREGGYDRTDLDQDQDNPYPPIVCAVDLDLGAEVLTLATPVLSPGFSQTPEILRDHAIVAISDAEGGVTILRIPLKPPNPEEIHNYVAGIKQSRITLRENGKITAHISMKLQSFYDDTNMATDDVTNQALLVAAIADTLSIWKLNIHNSETNEIHREILPHLGRHVTFSSSAKSDSLLFCDSSGAVRTYDPATRRWTMTYYAPFHTPKELPSFVGRKKLLDVKWVLGGRAIFALLEDGEWGIWDVNGRSQSGKSAQEFTICGYLDFVGTADVSDKGNPKITSSKLAPMTPKTRKSKAEDLFKAAPKTLRSSPSGGISILTASTRSTHQMAESAILWYANEVFSIPNLQAFWQRSTSGGSNTGTLYAPALTHLSDLNLMNEDITSVSQFASGNGYNSSTIGAKNIASDLLIAAEHRIIIVQSMRPSTSIRSLFDQSTKDRPTNRDQRMLAAGELGLQGMDRALDAMADANRPRKVGFAIQ